MLKKRQNFIESFIDIYSAKILEIGAFHLPTFQKPEVDIQYIDWFSKDELISKYETTTPERIKNAVEIDYVVKDKNFSRHISKKFNLVIANHVVEHIPDLILWFQNIESILENKGFLFLAVPHKEYTFDKLRNTTSLAQFIRNYDESLDTPNLYQVFDAMYYNRPIKGIDVWNENFDHLMGKKRFKNSLDALKDAYGRIQKEKYVDIHCNVFTYQSFLDICQELALSGYMSLKVIGAKDIEKPGNEFLVFLQKQ